VVALGDKSCVLEFVDNATSLNSILGASSNKTIFARGLHARHGDPQDWDYQTCFKAILDCYENDRTPEAQLSTYNDVCAHCSPVFRHYFAESTRSAREWFELRLTYTRSVASSSMAGHIVGLGDRHCSNILIRETGRQRGSVVHIDLGIIFDNARHLPRPEKIPFRMTRDMVDGMGLAQTDGVMSRCAEESLRVMRENKHSLLAIVDVLLHDPLESWKMSDHKREQKRDATGGDDCVVSNVDARIVRKTIKDKLEGLVRGELLGVQGHVKQLISEATSPENLSLLFQGWCAWY
jgi:ataxia telangiectasia mutated family protein